MTFLRPARRVLFLLIIALIAVPAFSLAQFYSSCGQFGNTSCSPGVLHVYVVVNNNTSSFTVTRQPPDFSVQVQAQNTPATTFPGSQSGTNISVAGTYTVQALPMQNFNPSYSQGCSGSVTANQEATCIITESAGSQYTDIVRPYPYAYSNSTLTCAPAYQTITLGSTVSMSAYGASGPYTWSTPDQTYQAIGPVFNTTPRTSGTYTVNVYSNTQVATCTVNVLASNGPVSFGNSYAQQTYYTQPYYSTQPTYTTGYTTGQYVYAAQPAAVLSASYIPSSVPNTGFEPMNSTLYAFALVVVISASIFISPYVRKTLAAIE